MKKLLTKLSYGTAKGTLSGTLLAAALFVGPAFAQAATLSLSPTSGTHTADTTFEVKVLLDTSSVSTDGTDFVLAFDPAVLEVVDANASTEGTQILAGSLYGNTTNNTVNNSSGSIRFSGTKSGSSSGYSGSGTLATITFKALKEATSTPVTFTFTSGATDFTDTNVIQVGASTDVLTSVTNGAYKITAASGSSDDEDSDGDGVPDSEDDDDDSNGSGSSGSDDDDSDGTGGGSDDVASSGIDLGGYALATLASLGGAGYFLTKPGRSSRKRR